jgi:NAD(P)-dependent dehydrogenase (short-subunit alcohol dehydrogenase family)
MTTIESKVVAITGAGSGIGRALAFEFQERGAHLALSDVNEAGLAETVAGLRKSTRFITHRVDVRDHAAVEAWASAVRAELGGADIIINNAGIASRGTVEEMAYDDFKLVIDVNLWGVVHGTRAFLPLLRLRPEGHIVNIASINAMVPFNKNGPYNMSKYAVYGLNETLIQELRGSNIRVTSVHPGGIRTNIVRNSKNFDHTEVATFDRIARTSPERAARTIIEAVENNRERCFVGADAKLMALSKRIIPALTVRVAGILSGLQVRKS